MTLGTWSAFALTVAALLAYWLGPTRWRSGILVVASYAFYMVAVPAHAVLLAVLTGGVYLIGRELRSRPATNRRRVLGLGVATTLAVLAVFKYAAFVAGTVNSMWSQLGLAGALTVPEWVAPLGISFVTFGLIHFLVEMYRGDSPAPTWMEFAAYVSFFPTVTSGPIKRYPQFVTDSRSVPGRPATADVAYGIWRILLGAFRKFVVADTIGVLAAPLLEANTTSPLIVVAVYAYAFKIYFDFAGYSDMAIGTARLFGFTVMENFDGPYLRRNLSEFWRTWHASLTRFITEYIYIPLGGNRRGTARAIVNTLVAMGLSGLWHGAAGHFIAWGLWHGVGLGVLRLWKAGAKRLRARVGWLDRVAATRVGRVASYGLGWALTFHYVVAGWVLFVLPVGESLGVYRALLRYAFELARRVAETVL
jgi:alginate O-acetyltransferase complex protein AlgI